MRQNIRKTLSYLLTVMLLASLAATLNAEPARTKVNNAKPKAGKQEPKKNTPPNNERKGDNRDDAKSGKIDRPGDGNSGQGDDKKDGFRDHKKDNKKPRHDPRTCPICKRHLHPLLSKKKPPQTNDKDRNNQGVRDRGQGEGRDGTGQGVENRKLLPVRKWDKREDIRDRREDRRDKHEDIKDRREDRRDKAEDKRDDKTDGGKWDRPEDRRDQREDVKDRWEDIRDRREDVRDRSEDKRDNKYPPRRKWDAGDNRDDVKSGKIDRPGDGNSGQGNDKGARLRPPHNPRTCSICNPGLRNKNEGEKPKIQPPPVTTDGSLNTGTNAPNDTNNDKTNNGVRDGGQGEGRDNAGQGKGQGDTNKENKDTGNSKK